MPFEFATVKVFVSSTWVDLQPECMAVETVLHQLRGAKFIGMEYPSSREHAPRDSSLPEVGPFHLYVAVIGWRYGSDITEDEYRMARSESTLSYRLRSMKGASQGKTSPMPAA